MAPETEIDHHRPINVQFLLISRIHSTAVYLSDRMMRTISQIFILFAMLLETGAQAADRLENLLIQGENLIISVKEPMGWIGDSNNTTTDHDNLVFYRMNETLQSAKAVIRVLVANKTDENTIEDLKYDMESYRKQYPKIQFKDISVKHPEYSVYAKLFYVDTNFYEYVTYLNPGKNHPYIISVSMNLKKNEASKEDIEAYSFVIESLKALK
jgi:hypothetical protein